MTDLHVTLYRKGRGNLLGAAGRGPVASSLFGKASLRHWHQILEPYLRRSDLDMSSRWYLPVGSDQAALVFTDPGGSGRPHDYSAVVLLGPERVLTWRLALTVPTLALARLTTESAGGRIPMLPVAPHLLGQAQVETASVETRARDPEVVEAAARLVAARWADPRSALAIAAVPTPAVSVLWNACHVLAAFADRLPDRAAARLGFGTRPGTGTDEMPSVLLWPPGKRTAELGGPQRALDLDTAPPGTTAARHLVEQAHTYGAAGPRDLLDEHGVLTLKTFRERIRVVRELWDADRAPTRPIPTVAAHSTGSPSTPPEPEEAAPPHPPPPQEEPPTVSPPPAPPPAGTGDGVLCPICLSRIPLDNPALYTWNGGAYRPLELSSSLSEARRNWELSRAQVLCPNDGASTERHYLPYDYVRSDPVVLSFVGSSASGKTHLLVAMIGAALERGELEPFGLTAAPLDARQYEEFHATKVVPFLDQRRVLQRTRPDIHHAEVGLRISGDGVQPRAVALFDVQGEDLSRYSKAEQRLFLDAVHGLIFLVDPDQLGGDTALGDPAFSTILNLLPDARDTAAALVLVKADQLRFTYPVDRWLRQPTTGLDADAFLAESEDLYAFLHADDRARPWLQPYSTCRRATLHVASATGGPVSAGGDRFARPVRPRRVLEPLVALLAMTGVIDTDEARKVGR